MMGGDVNTFMATMVAPSRPVPIERALALVRERYGFAPRAARLTGERDENFKLTTADGAVPHVSPRETPRYGRPITTPKGRLWLDWSAIDPRVARLRTPGSGAHHRLG